jgi:diguanylate cyclase (GGDEF)-like protein
VFNKIFSGIAIAILVKGKVNVFNVLLTYGHGDGDIVLKELGKVLSKSCRVFDIVSRNGGEEFTVLLLDCAKENALQIAERIRSNIETHQFILSSGTQISITVSIGVASYPKSLNEVEKLVEMSDMHCMMLNTQEDSEYVRGTYGV